MNKKILIVRENSQGAKALSFLLAGIGYGISAHTNLTSAVESAEHQKFDLAITDRKLPECEEMDVVNRLKQAQPSLPIFLLSDGVDLDSIIGCIRAGVTEIIQEPNNLREVVRTTTAFLKSGEDSSAVSDVTISDIEEVDEILSSIGLAAFSNAEQSPGDAAGGASDAKAGEVEDLRQKLEEIEEELRISESKRKKNEAILNELQNTTKDGAASASILEKEAELEEREKHLEELAEKVARQKVNVETLLAEVESDRIEQDELQDTGGLSEEEASEYREMIEALEKQVDEIKLSANEQRLDSESSIQKLTAQLDERDESLEEVAALKELLEEARADTQITKETLAEKEFVLNQQKEQLAKAKEAMDLAPEVENIEEEKRLLEIEKFKLQQKLDEMESEQSKMQREISVEKRDAEISLREMQTKIKEEQLKLQVDMANIQEEKRVFDQARENFQEDIQELQRQQEELKIYEQKLKSMEREMGDGNLPALPESPDTSSIESLAEKAFRQKAEANVGFGEKPNPTAAPTPAPAPPAPPSGTDKSSDSWTKPDFKKKGSRGPLRIGKRSSF